MIKNIQQNECEEKYRFITEFTNEIFCVLNDNFEIEYVSDLSLKKNLGYSCDFLIGNNFLNYLHSEDIEKITKTLEKIDGIREISQEIRFKAKNNKFLWFEIKIGIFEDSANKKSIVLLTNINKRKNLEQKLIESEDRFKDVTIQIPEIRFWKLFYPKKFEEALKMSYNMLQRVVDNIPEIIFWKDENLVYLGCNNNYAKLIGIESPEKVIGKTDKNFNFDKEKIKYISREEKDIIKSGIAKYNTIKPWILKDGTQIWLNMNRIPLRDSKNKIVGLLVKYENITDRKKAEEKLKESEEKFRTFTEQSFTGISIVQDNLLKYVNQQLAQIFGYTTEELLNLPPGGSLKLIHPEDRGLAAELTLKRQRGEYDNFNNYQFRGIKKNGDIIWLDFFGKSIKFEGRPSSFGILIDITEKKKIDEIKSKLLTRFSHEFKTPLVSINGYIDLLLKEYRERFDNDTIYMLKEVKKGSTRLKNLINLFIESSELGEKLVKVNFKEENLQSFLESCLDELRGLIRLRAHKINLDVQVDLILKIDRERMKEVITNLLVNSIKYTPPGGNIIINSRIRDNFVVISIKDNGIGLTEEEKLQLFKKFGKIERYGHGWNILSEGSGMGLYISKELIKLHGGKVWAESEGRNKGSTFYISLPLKM